MIGLDRPQQLSDGGARDGEVELVSFSGEEGGSQRALCTEDHVDGRLCMRRKLVSCRKSWAAGRLAVRRRPRFMHNRLLCKMIEKKPL